MIRYIVSAWAEGAIADGVCPFGAVASAVVFSGIACNAAMGFYPFMEAAVHGVAATIARRSIITGRTGGACGARRTSVVLHIVIAIVHSVALHCVLSPLATSPAIRVVPGAQGVHA